MKVAVFGAGTMGSGIAQVFAAKGHTALMYASSTASAQRHKDKLAASLNKKVAKGKMTQEAADDIMSRVLVEEFEGAADADLVIECVAENMAVKKELLGKLDALCKDETIFASNSQIVSRTARISVTTHDSAARPTSTRKMPSARAVWARYHGRNTVITSAPYSSGADNRSTCARRTIPPSSASPNDKTAYIMFRASFFDLWYVTIGRQTL